MRHKRQKIIVFDSGLGGLTVYHALRQKRPDADYLYVADEAYFPYGALADDVLIERVRGVIRAAQSSFNADAIVIACNTASTLVLPHLRAEFDLPIIGTVPAIKPAAALTQTGMISVLATPATVRRDYTADLIREFASEAQVTLVGAPQLAPLAERYLHEGVLDYEAVRQECAACFVEKKGEDAALRRTDVIVLACTHYPLILAALRALSPWPVEFIDPAPALARRLVQLLGEQQAEGEGTTRFQSCEKTSDPASSAPDWVKIEQRLREIIPPPAS